jgi:hypothetical protein
LYVTDADLLFSSRTKIITDWHSVNWQPKYLEEEKERKTGLPEAVKLAERPSPAMVPPALFQLVKVKGVIPVPVTLMLVAAISPRTKDSPAFLLIVTVPVARRVAFWELVMFGFSAGSLVQAKSKTVTASAGAEKTRDKAARLREPTSAEWGG